MINELESLRAFPPGNATAATTTLAAAGPPQIGVGPQQSAPAATVASLTGKPAGHCSDISARPRAGGGGHDLQPQSRFLSRGAKNRFCQSFTMAEHGGNLSKAMQAREAAILRDADRLDALGAIGLARWFAVSAAMGTALYDPDDPFALARDLDDRRYALDHWQVKLGRLSQGMLTARGRQLATARRAGMVVVLRDLAAEIGADLPEDWARGPE